MWLQYFIDGLTLGSIYGILALSYALIFGVIRIVNFAQGELITIGAFGAIGMWSITDNLNLGLRLPLIILAGIGAACIVGLLMERMLFRPLLKRNSPSLLGLIASLGVSIFIQNILRITVSSSDILFPTIVSNRPMSLASVNIAPVQIMIVGLALVFAVVTIYFVEKTRFGITIMAVRDEKELASVNGISVNKVLRGVFIAASILASVGGLMMGLYYGVARYDMGFLPGIKAFTASIMGGVGNVRGAIIAGMLLGIIESFGAAYLSYAYKDGFAFLLLIIVLLVKPSGLLGQRESV